MNPQHAKALRTAPLQTPTDFKPEAVREITGALNILLADMFGLYLKTKNFHWHVSGPHFRDYHPGASLLRRGCGRRGLCDGGASPSKRM
jgi:starvation-inducible DNA-binding protein